VFFQRWLHRLPLPLAPADRDAGWWWELSMAQVEVSRTICFTQPRYARAFFDALVTDNLDLGRPEAAIDHLHSYAKGIDADRQEPVRRSVTQGLEREQGRAGDGG
jgi:hypothetical protein